MWMPKLKP